LETRLSSFYPIETRSRAGGLRMARAPAFVRRARRSVAASNPLITTVIKIND